MRARNSLLSVLALLLVVACTNVPKTKNGITEEIIEMETYSISLSADKWSDWTRNRASKDDVFILEKVKIWPFNGQLQGGTAIYVMRDSVGSEGWDLTVVQHADNIRDIEENIMRGKAQSEGKYVLQDVSRGELPLSGKDLYFLKWKTTTGSTVRAGFRGDFFATGAMYLYFPDDFEKTHVLYKFLIVDSYMPGSLLPKVPMEQIYSIINGFSVK